MFAHIANLKTEDIKGPILAAIYPYATEGLNMSGNQYKYWISVEAVFTQHITPKIESYAVSHSSADEGMVKIDMVPEEVKEESKTKHETKVEQKEESAQEKADSLIASLENLKITKGIDYIPQSQYDQLSAHILKTNIVHEGYNNLLQDIVDQKVVVLGQAEYENLL